MHPAHEAAETDLRQAPRAASVELRETPEFQALTAKGAEFTHDFLKNTLPSIDAEELDFAAEFIVLLITSFAERTTDARTSGARLTRQACLLVCDTRRANSAGMTTLAK